MESRCNGPCKRLRVSEAGGDGTRPTESVEQTASINSSAEEGPMSHGRMDVPCLGPFGDATGVDVSHMPCGSEHEKNGAETIGNPHHLGASDKDNHCGSFSPISPTDNGSNGYCNTLCHKGERDRDNRFEQKVTINDGNDDNCREYSSECMNVIDSNTVVRFCSETGEVEDDSFDSGAICQNSNQVSQKLVTLNVDVAGTTSDAIQKEIVTNCNSRNRSQIVDNSNDNEYVCSTDSETKHAVEISAKDATDELRSVISSEALSVTEEAYNASYNAAAAVKATQIKDAADGCLVQERRVCHGYSSLPDICGADYGGLRHSHERINFDSDRSLGANESVVKEDQLDCNSFATVSNTPHGFSQFLTHRNLNGNVITNKSSFSGELNASNEISISNCMDADSSHVTVHELVVCDSTRADDQDSKLVAGRSSSTAKTMRASFVNLDVRSSSCVSNNATSISSVECDRMSASESADKITVVEAEEASTAENIGESNVDVNVEFRLCEVPRRTAARTLTSQKVNQVGKSSDCGEGKQTDVDERSQVEIVLESERERTCRQSSGEGIFEPNCDIGVGEPFMWPFDVAMETTDNNMHINSLPLLNLVHIFRYLSPATLLNRVSLVCRYWYNSSRDPALWRRINLAGQNKMADAHLLNVVLFSDRILEVNLTDCQNITDASVHTILQRCIYLQSLKLVRCHYVNNAFWGRSPGSLPCLKTLHVCGCYKFDDTALSMMARACCNLQSLHANQCNRLTDEGVTELANQCPNLRQLFIDHCVNVTDAGLKMLVQCCPKLTSLNLMACGLTDTGILHLHQLSNLTNLDISNLPRISPPAIAQLARKCHTLECLNVSLNPSIDNDCVTEIARGSPNLYRLYCVSCAVSESGVEALVQYCPKLAYLDLGWCQSITDDCVRLISSRCRNLKYLGLIRCDRVTPEVVDEMLQEHPQISYSTFILESRRLMEKARQHGIMLDVIDPAAV